MAMEELSRYIFLLEESVEQVTENKMLLIEIQYIEYKCTVQLHDNAAMAKTDKKDTIIIHFYMHYLNVALNKSVSLMNNM